MVELLRGRPATCRTDLRESLPRFAHRARCASAIFALVTALFFGFPGLPTLRAFVSPASSALAACSR
jgi:hypothetical protein